MFETIYLYVPSQELPNLPIFAFVLLFIIVHLIRYLIKEKNREKIVIILLIIAIIWEAKILINNYFDMVVLNNKSRIEEISSKSLYCIEGEVEAVIIDPDPTANWTYSIVLNGKTYEIARMYGQDKVVNEGDHVKIFIANDFVYEDEPRDPYYDYVLRIDVWHDKG